MVNVSIQCPAEGCDFETGAYAASIVAAILNAHTVDRHQQQARAAPPRPPKVDRPSLTDDLDEEQWNVFQQSWNIFMHANRVADQDKAYQLYSCCSNTLKAKITSVHQDFLTKAPQDLIPLLKTLTVTPVAISVKRNELLQMRQDAGETIRTFQSRLKAKATTCMFKIRCTHNHVQDGNGNDVDVQVDYTSEMIRHVILNGIYDDEIKRDIFGSERIDIMELNELIALIESKETARDATNDMSTNSLSQYKKRYKPPPPPQQPPVDVSKKGKCSSCPNTYLLYSKMRNGQYNKKPFTHCKDCWTKHHSRKRAENTPENTEVAAENNAILFEISSATIIESTQQPLENTSAALPPTQSLSNTINDVNIPSHPEQSLEPAPVLVSDKKDATVESPEQTSYVLASETDLSTHRFSKQSEHNIVTDYHAGHVILRHHVFQDGKWKLKLAQPHPTVPLTLSTFTDDYELFKLRCPNDVSTQVTAVADSGAQVCIWSWSQCRAAGFTRGDLIPVKQKLNAVSKSPITIYGAVLLRLQGISASGEEHFAAAVVYVSPEVTSFYMSRDVMIQLGIIPHGFPEIGSSLPGKNYSENASMEQGNEKCPCLPRCPPPGRPDELPMEATEANIPLMKAWILKRYESSVFNKCPHQPSPKMKGPPMRIHVDPNAKGKAITTPLRVPIHWESQVEHDLQKDVTLQVIEPVPHGETSKWVHRMLVVRKPNGEIRRVVHLSPLNKHCEREVHAMQSPFELAKGIPPDTWRTVCDAWNGYHSIPLHEDDRHLTTFLSPFGHRYRYLVAPQGYASSGDGYNRRCDEIFLSFERHKRCTDDNLLYDPHASLEEHWWRIIDFLECCGINGIILNVAKFQFCQKDVDFAGFHLTSSTVEPLPKYLESIQNFPTPKSITDIQS